MNISSLANRALLTKLLAAATTYGFTLVLARTMLPQEFGKIALFLNLSLVLSVLGARGQQLAALRFLPPMLAKRNAGLAGLFIKHAFRKASHGTFIVLLVAVVVALLALVSGQAPAFSAVQIGLGLSLIPLVGWIDLQSHIARGFRRFQLSLIPKEVLWRAATTAVVLGLFLQSDQNPLGASQVLSGLILTLIVIASTQGVILWRLADPGKSGGTAHPHEPADWATSGNAFWLTSVSNIFLANVDVILVGLMVGPAAAGFYFAANRLALLLSFFLISYNVVLAPLLAETWQTGSRHDAEQIIHAATVKMTWPSLALGILLGWFAPELLGLFGPDFVAAVTPLRLLILAGVLNAASGPADIALNMCGFQKSAMRAGAVSLAVSALLLPIGAYLGGVTGIALAVLLATIVRKALFWWLARKLMAIRTDIFAIPRRRPVQFFAIQK